MTSNTPQPVSKDDVISRLRKFAEELNSKAVADGFAGDEIGFKILDILDAQPEAKQAEDANRYVHFVEYLIGDRTDLDDAFVECKSKSDVDAILDAAIAGMQQGAGEP